MLEQCEQRAQEVVQQFKDLLGDEARAALSDYELEQLAGLIREAIAEELEAAADLVEMSVDEIRSEVERPEIEL